LDAEEWMKYVGVPISPEEGAVLGLPRATWLFVKIL